MNSSTFTRRFINALAALAALAVAAFALGVALDSHALALFCVLASAFTSMIAVRDYAPTLSSAKERHAGPMPAATTRSKERMPLAA